MTPKPPVQVATATEPLQVPMPAPTVVASAEGAPGSDTTIRGRRA
jgi:hypothetical protein